MNPAGSSRLRKRKHERLKGKVGKVAGGFECGGCGKVYKRRGDANRHYLYSCPKGPQIREKCRYCGEEVSPHSLRTHLKLKHKGQPVYMDLAIREKTQDDLELEKMLTEIGDPGGDKEFREGVMFVYDYKLRIGRHYFEEVDPRCINHDKVKKDTDWVVDENLPSSARLSGKDVKRIRSATWHFAHLVCAAYHYFDEKRKAMTKLSSVGSIQSASVNQGPLSQLETAFKFLCLLYWTFIHSATVLGPNPQMCERKKVAKKKANEEEEEETEASEEEEEETEASEEEEDETEASKVKEVAKAIGLIKIAVCFDKEGTWYWDGYYIPNEESSNKSPNAYRLESFAKLDKVSEHPFLSRIRDVAQQRNLFEEGNAAKHRWLAENPAPVPEPEALENLPDSAIGMDFESQMGSQMSVDGTPQLDPKDARIAELEAEIKTLRAQLDAAYLRIAELEGN